jgi:hypothetical protein
MGDSLVRPRLSSGAKKLAGLFARKRRRGRLSVISVIVRRDGAVAINGDSGPTGADKGRTPVIFHFRAPGAAEAVMAGALRRLANERMDESKLWYLDISAGQAAAAIKAEAKGLSCSFAIIHPYLTDAPVVGSSGRIWARRATSMTSYAIILSAGGLIGFIVGFMLKGS